MYHRDHEQPFEPNVDQNDNLLNLPEIRIDVTRQWSPIDAGARRFAPLYNRSFLIQRPVAQDKRFSPVRLTQTPLQR